MCRHSDFLETNSQGAECHQKWSKSRHFLETNSQGAEFHQKWSKSRHFLETNSQGAEFHQKWPKSRHFLETNQYSRLGGSLTSSKSLFFTLPLRCPILAKLGLFSVSFHHQVLYIGVWQYNKTNFCKAFYYSYSLIYSLLYSQIGQIADLSLRTYDLIGTGIIFNKSNSALQRT